MICRMGICFPSSRPSPCLSWYWWAQPLPDSPSDKEPTQPGQQMLAWGLEGAVCESCRSVQGRGGSNQESLSLLPGFGGGRVPSNSPTQLEKSKLALLFLWWTRVQGSTHLRERCQVASRSMTGREERVGGNPSFNVDLLSDLFKDPLKGQRPMSVRPMAWGLELKTFQVPSPAFPHRRRDAWGGALRDTHTVGSGRLHSLKQQQCEGTPSFFHS